MLDIESALQRPMYYHRDGTPIVDNELLPATLQWALMFEDGPGRTIGRNRTLYGERLSTVWLGMEHGWDGGRPLIFETMLFAPKRDDAQADREMNKLRAMGEACRRANETGEELELLEASEAEKKDEEFKKRFPHDQMQMRYASEHDARETHERLMMQCLIPPRWRHFLLWTIGRQQEWSFYDDDDNEF
jgi:hypothetical protein